jgi:hypothetical protein
MPLAGFRSVDALAYYRRFLLEDLPYVTDNENAQRRGDDKAQKGSLQRRARPPRRR